MCVCVSVCAHVCVGVRVWVCARMTMQQAPHVEMFVTIDRIGQLQGDCVSVDLGGLSSSCVRWLTQLCSTLSVVEGGESVQLATRAYFTHRRTNIMHLMLSFT